ncbi:MAG: choice-of-anchor J domain-containing protein [Bacteroidota bacterium]
MRKFTLSVLVLLVSVFFSFGQAKYTKTTDIVKSTTPVVNVERPDGLMADTYSIDFEAEVAFTFDFMPWTVVDVDGLPVYGMTGVTWPNSGDPQAFIVFNPDLTDPPITDDPDILPYEGEQFGACLAAVPDGSQGNDDWFISDMVTIGTDGDGANFNFYARTYLDNWGLERFNVAVSTTTPDPGDFTVISGATYIEAPMAWTYYEFDLSAYAGMDIYVAIQCVTYDAFIFMIDNLMIDVGGGGGGGNCDNFDSYVAGDLLCPQSGGFWTTWDDNPGGDYDGYVVDDMASSTPNSLGVDAAVIETDVVTDLGQTTAGVWDVNLDIYIPDGGTYGGYFNVMQDMELFGAANEWGFQVYFRSDGTGYFLDADFNQTDFTYPVAAWVHCSLEVDLDMAMASFYLDGVMQGASWQWDIAGPNMLGAADIYAAADGNDDPKFYIDNFCFEEVVPADDCDYFDTYVAGDFLCTQSDLWWTWDDNPGGDYDAYVVDDMFQTAPNSLGVDAAVIETDVLYDLGQTTSGAWEIALEIYVPDGGYGAYYNVMQDMELFGAANEWGFQVYFRSDGTGYCYDADFNQYDFTYTVGEWTHCVLSVDLDNHGAVYYVNEEAVGNWAWDVAGPNMLGAVDVYAAADGNDDPKCYIDNFCYYPVDATGIENPVATTSIETAIFPNPAKDHVTIEANGIIDEILIYNNMGQLVYSGEVNDDQIMVNTSTFITGMYIVQVKSGNAVEVRKLIIE